MPLACIIHTHQCVRQSCISIKIEQQLLSRKWQNCYEIVTNHEMRNVYTNALHLWPISCLYDTAIKHQALRRLYYAKSPCFLVPIQQKPLRDLLPLYYAPAPIGRRH